MLSTESKRFPGGVVGRLLGATVLASSGIFLIHKLGAGEFSIKTENETPGQKTDQLFELGEDVELGEVEEDHFSGLVERNWYDLSPEDRLELSLRYPEYLHDVIMTDEGHAKDVLLDTIEEILLDSELLLSLPHKYDCDEVLITLYSWQETGWKSVKWAKHQYLIIKVTKEGKIFIYFKKPNSGFDSEGTSSEYRFVQVPSLVQSVRSAEGPKSVVVSLRTTESIQNISIDSDITFGDKMFPADESWLWEYENMRSYKPLQQQIDWRLSYVRRRGESEMQRFTFLSEEDLVTGEEKISGPYYVNPVKIETTTTSLSKTQIPAVYHQFVQLPHTQVE